MKRITILTVLLLTITLASAGCSRNPVLPKGADTAPEHIKVYATFYPLYYFADRIAGDRAEVESLVPAGVEPHDYEPSMKQVAGIYDAKVFVFLGEAMEPWAKKLEDGLSQKGVTVLEVGEGIIEEEDPHVWLDPILAKELAHKIYLTLAKADANNSSYYEQNYLALSNQLDELHEALKSDISKSSRRDVVTSHATLGYLARRYGLNQVAIAGLSPQEEPSLRKMAELSQLVRERDVKYIFTETMGSNKLSDALAREVGISTLEFNPLETLSQEEIDAGRDYLSVMWQNIEVLEKALAD